MSATRKHSRQRDAVLACLRATRTHPTANWVFQQLKPDFPTLSLATVYRNLTTLRKDGLIQSVGFVDGFERFDADISPHPHFTCQRCHSVVDIELPEIPEQVRQAIAQAVPAEEFSVSLRFTGLCQQCSRRSL